MSKPIGRSARKERQYRRREEESGKDPGGKAGVDRVDAFLRDQIEERFQTLLEEEATAWLGRPRSTRRRLQLNGRSEGLADDIELSA